MWHAAPHLASCPCGGLLAKVAGVNVPDAASYSNVPYPHPCVSENLLLSFSMNSTANSSPGTVSGVLAEKGGSVSFFGLHSIFAIFEPSGKGFPLPGTPFLYASIITRFARMSLITFWASVRLGLTACQSSYPLNSENGSPFGTATVYLSCAA